MLEPIIDLERRIVFAYEMLLRLIKNNNTIHRSSHIIQAAEDLRIIQEIDTIALYTVIDLLRIHQHSHMTMNLSCISLEDRSWVDMACGVLLEANDVIRDKLILEITETIAPNDINILDQNVRKLRKHGCLIAFDDFGVGHATFSAPHAIDVDYIKIDKIYGQSIHNNLKSRAVVNAIVSFCDALEIAVIIEGIQCEKTATYAQKCGIKYAQGRYFDKYSKRN